MKRSVLKNYVEGLLDTCDEDNRRTVSFNEWIAWITHEKHVQNRRDWVQKPWRSFIVILSLTQLILGIIKRIEKAYICYDYSFAGHKTCPYVRPFHDAMIFKSCLRFEAWRYVTHAFAHHGTPHLLINLAFQVFFGKTHKYLRCTSLHCVDVNQFLVHLFYLHLCMYRVLLPNFNDT